MGSGKKHKKHKSERKSKYDERPASLKLILKVGGTPENSPASYGIQSQPENEFFSEYIEKHKKSKKKKKKKDREKRHKHHKEKKHRASNDEDNSMEEDDNSQLNDNPLYYSSVSTSSNISSTPVTKSMIPIQIHIDQEQATPLSESCFSPSDSKLSAKQEDQKMSLESPTTPSSMDSGNAREPRTCVLKLKQSRSPLAKLLEHLLKVLEKRDPHQFFAWPVTDLIAPGYSSIITKPMDFSTMRQKIEDNEYSTMNEFADDFKLMCENAILYNHAETVYHKAAKRLLHVGTKMLQPDSLIRTFRPLTAYMKELTAKELGFDFNSTSECHDNDMHAMDSADETAMSTAADEHITAQYEEEEKRKQRKLENDPKTKFEPFVDNLTSEEILAQVKTAAKTVRERMFSKRKASKMGFLRTHNDGTTSLQILVNNGEDTPERMPTLGNFIGKLQQGTGQLQGFPREDRRNLGKMPKTLDYGAFGSYAPIFDSRFSNLSKDETEMILNTYGDESGSQYADSILKFSKDSFYASTLANRLLDLLTCGEHSKTMEVLEESERQKTCQNEVDKALPDWNQEAKRLQNVQIDFERLRSLKDLGMDVNFVDEIERFMKGIKTEGNLQEQLNSNATLMEQLHQVQHERLSGSLPHHLSHVSHPDKTEVQIANQITTNLTEIAKKLPPNSIASLHGIRKAMGFDLMKKTDLTSVDMDLEPQKSNQSEHDDIDNELQIF